MSDEKQQALFEAWADHAFGPSTKLPQTERFTSYWKCWQAALAPQPKPAPVLLTDEEMREALELIAAPKRPDGTWNRDREACRQLAAEALGRYDEKQKGMA